MGKIVIHQTDEKQTVILKNDADSITGVYFGEDGVEKPVGNDGEWTTEGFIEGTEPSGDIVYNGSSEVVKAGLFWSNKAITSFFAPNTWKANENAFNAASNLKTLYLGGTPTSNSSSLANYAVRYCSSLEEIRIPKSNSSFGFGGFGLEGCRSLKKVELNEYANNLFFSNMPADTPLEVIILRGHTARNLGEGALNSSSYFKQGGLGGKLYVPSTLVETYKTQGGWSTYYGYGTMQILPIEGSEYEI